MQTFLRGVALGIGVLLLSGVQLPAQETDPLVGTWELNLAKSKFGAGRAPKSETRTYVVSGQDVKATTKGIDSAGQPTAAEFIVNYDGKDRPVTGNPDAEMLSLKRVDPFTTEFTQKRAGKVVITGTRIISRDGKVMTITTKGTDATGTMINDVAVFEKR